MRNENRAAAAAAGRSMGRGSGVEASRSGNEVGARVGPEIVARPTPGSTTGKYMYADGKRDRHLCGMLNFAGY